METISIIIPIYNVEKFVKQAVNSALNQTYKNLEIILVDDGSTDASGQICDEYSAIDARVKVIHQVNRGLSAARNAGLEIATGMYVMFLDADDFLEENACEVLYHEIEKTKADYVIGNYIHVTYNGQKWNKPLFDTEKYTQFKLSIEDYQKSFFVMNSVVWNKIFRRAFIEKHQLRFIPKAIAEDAIFSIYCYTHTDNAYYINDVVYNYRQNEANVSISTNCTKQYFERLNESYKKISDYFEQTNTLGFYRYFYARIMPYLLCKIIDTDSVETEEEMIDILKILSWFFKQKQTYQVAVVDGRLESLVDDINNQEYVRALDKIKETKEYRKGLTDVAREKMYAPNEELYRRMSKK